MSRSNRPWFWMQVLIIGCLMVSRRPDAVFHPQFWAEDGQVFYHDAYMIGPAALLHPLGGYLNTLSRLGALLAVNFPLAWAPVIYMVVAFAFQLLPVILLLSSRMDAALPSWPARLAMAYFYAAVPNSNELNINLTDAQWHLAIAAFLLLTATPAVRPALKRFDSGLMILCGFSGPFCIFLTPIAWFEHRRKRVEESFLKAAILTAATLVQFSFILFVAESTRGKTPLGASLGRFFEILCNNLVLGGPLGYAVMTRLTGLPAFSEPYLAAGLTVIAGGMVAMALRTGPVLYREAAFLAACLFAASLFSPMVSLTIPQWQSMVIPGHGMRYEFMPMLVWFASFLILAVGASPVMRAAAMVFTAACLVGIWFNWSYVPYLPTGFTAQAETFDHAAKKTTMDFPENPYGWHMVLTKR